MEIVHEEEMAEERRWGREKRRACRRGGSQEEVEDLY